MAREPAGGEDLTLGRKLLILNWPLVALLCFLAAIGIGMLYSAGGGSWEPWAMRQVVRFSAALALMLAVALVDFRFWLRHAYLIYFATIALLIGVEVAGATGMGAQRWIDFGRRPPATVGTDEDRADPRPRAIFPRHLGRGCRTAEAVCWRRC